MKMLLYSFMWLPDEGWDKVDSDSWTTVFWLLIPLKSSGLPGVSRALHNILLENWFLADELRTPPS